MSNLAVAKAKKLVSRLVLGCFFSRESPIWRCWFGEIWCQNLKGMSLLITEKRHILRTQLVFFFLVDVHWAALIGMRVSLVTSMISWCIMMSRDWMPSYDVIRNLIALQTWANGGSPSQPSLHLCISIQLKLWAIEPGRMWKQLECCRMKRNSEKQHMSYLKTVVLQYPKMYGWNLWFV